MPHHLSTWPYHHQVTYWNFSSNKFCIWKCTVVHSVYQKWKKELKHTHIFSVHPTLLHILDFVLIHFAVSLCYTFTPFTYTAKVFDVYFELTTATKTSEKEHAPLTPGKLQHQQRSTAYKKMWQNNKNKCSYFINVIYWMWNKWMFKSSHIDAILTMMMVLALDMLWSR